MLECCIRRISTVLASLLVYRVPSLSIIGALVWLLPCVGGRAARAQEPATEPLSPHKTKGGLELRNRREVVRVTFCAGDAVHVMARPADAASSPATPQPWIVQPCSPVPAAFTADAKTASASAGKLRVAVDLASGALRVADSTGNVLLEENGVRPRRYAPANVPGASLYQVSDRFSPETLEGLYGLGQHQSGVFNYRGSVIELSQANSDVAVPLLLSSNGYGLFWNTASRSQFDDRFSHELKFTADAAQGIDFYVLYGPEMDAIIAHYRELTGHAPLLGRWAYGFVQSKDRYTSAKQLLDIAGQYRAEHVPLDVIVQDWFWWRKQGDPEYADAYLQPQPDVPEALRKLHAMGVHAIISTWAVFDPTSENFRTMAAQHLLIPGTPDYDASNPAAREFFWDNFIGKKAAEGWDGFWLDSSEPETWRGESDGVLWDRTLHIGPGALYTNVFPLLHTGNVYEHWRKSTPARRLFLLTRSAFAGQQRNSAVVWSGDIYGTFPVLRRQIAAGLNFALSGMPYWTTDTAGYTSPYKDEPNNPEYQELYTRWFEFTTFCPILRTHGHRSANELFSYGPQTPTLVAYDRLRSRMLPYTYALAWRVTHEDYTMQRPLVMDWRTDERVRNLDDEFMFGPALLVSPVTVPEAKERLVYLPAAAGWYDFWSGERVTGGQQIVAKAPLDRIPLYVRAGSILPLGPAVEYAAQQPSDPIELRIFPGADGDFTLYDDAGDGYGYEKGEYATVALHWDDTKHTLRVDERKGGYPGMSPSMRFRVHVIGDGAGNGFDEATETKVVTYSGAAMEITPRQQ